MFHGLSRPKHRQVSGIGWQRHRLSEIRPIEPCVRGWRHMPFDMRGTLRKTDSTYRPAFSPSGRRYAQDALGSVANASLIPPGLHLPAMGDSFTTSSPGLADSGLACRGNVDGSRSCARMRTENRNDHGSIVTMTRLYCDKGGLPLSVTFRMKCTVAGLPTFGAATST
jgi:hypothetical protein